MLHARSINFYSLYLSISLNHGKSFIIMSNEIMALFLIFIFETYLLSEAKPQSLKQACRYI